MGLELIAISTPIPNDIIKESVTACGEPSTPGLSGGACGRAQARAGARKGNGGGAVNVKAAIDSRYYKKVKDTEIPAWIPAMKAKLTHTPFSDPGWIYEHKLDGERVVIRKRGGEPSLYSRNKKRLNDTYPELEKALGDINGEWWLDGEVVAFDGSLTSFRTLQRRMHLKNREEAEASDTNVYLYLFDCMYAGGCDLRGLPLSERKKVLAGLFDFTSPLFLLEWRSHHGREYLKEACQNGGEGVLAKDNSSIYTSTRTSKWQKFRCDRQQEFVVVGYTEPHGQRTYFGALLLGYYERDRFRYAGKVGTGFDEETRADMLERFNELEINESPVHDTGKAEGAHWVRPKVVVQIGFTEWTQDGKLRHPRFIGVRRDKKPEHVVREEF